MATGASTAEVAILLVDARHGVREQTERHSRIARLLGITHFVLAVNKMDLMDFDRGVFESIREDFTRLVPTEATHAIPLERARRRQRHRAERAHALVRGTGAPAVSGNRRSGTRARLGCVSDARAAREPPRSLVPRLCGADRVRPRRARRPADHLPVRAHRVGQTDRDLRWRPGRGVCADVRDARARPGSRRQPGRRAGRRAGAGRQPHRSGRRVDGRTAPQSEPDVSDQAQRPNGRGGSGPRAHAERDRQSRHHDDPPAAVRSVPDRTARPAASS